MIKKKKARYYSVCPQNLWVPSRCWHKVSFKSDLLLTLDSALWFKHYIDNVTSLKEKFFQTFPLIDLIHRSEKSQLRVLPHHNLTTWIIKIWYDVAPTVLKLLRKEMWMCYLIRWYFSVLIWLKVAWPEKVDIHWSTAFKFISHLSSGSSHSMVTVWETLNGFLSTNSKNSAVPSVAYRVCLVVMAWESMLVISCALQRSR